MHALDAWRGALLLEPVGSGKTWIALAVAAQESRPALAIVPAILQDQWRAASGRAGVRLELWTHERLSRGRLPASAPALVIIDEAHRFRDAGTRRVQTVAPLLTGKRVLLLTATPIVNRVGDWITLLRLALSEDALALSGLAGLGDLETLRLPPAALRRVAIRTSHRTDLPAKRSVINLTPTAAEECRGARAVAMIRSLELSQRVPTRRLLMSVLLDAAASSEAAFRAALRRYRALLLHALDAGGASRAMLRRFAGEALEQTALWSMLSPDDAPGELPQADIARVERILATPERDDCWTAPLMERCGDGRPTICFARHRSTALVLRRGFGERTAWVTGSDAGIGPHRIARESVLAAFGPARSAWRDRRQLPQVLVATDVAAEGLDLHGAGRIVHVDLPWTATRLEQREGRLLRLGQLRRQVEVVVRTPCAAIEAAFGPRRRVNRKRRIADQWLTSLVVDDERASCVFSRPPVSWVEDGQDPAILVAVELSRGRRQGVVLVARIGDGAWQANSALAHGLWHRARFAADARPDWTGLSAELESARRAAMIAADSAPGAAPALVDRIHRLARLAAISRRGADLQRLDRLLRYATAAGTLADRIVLANLQRAGDAECLRIAVPDVEIAGSIHAAVISAIIFRPRPTA